MDPKALHPQNFEERLIWYAIVGTYGFYLIGGLYIVAPVLAWILLGYLCLKLWLQHDQTPPADRITIPIGVWIWVAAMLVMELALIFGHLDFDLGTGLMIKSSIGWAKGWALLAIFPLIGCLKIRPQLIYRAACIVCLQTLLFFPIFLLAYLLHLPETPYVSPLKAVGGPGPEFFAMSLYELDPASGTPRWRLFTPWAPALGFVANIYFIFAFQEKHGWKWIGIIGSILMCLVSQSRLALVSVVSVMTFTWALTHLTRPLFLFGLGIVSMIGGVIASQLLEAFDRFRTAFRAARADSSRVRETLGRIAVQRWQNEAPIWGHGVVRQGPHLVEYMPIGSHHSWYGLLYVKGIVGLIALAVPMLWSFIELVIKGQSSQLARAGLSMILILWLYTFGENLEILAYLFWPALVVMGQALQEPLQLPILKQLSPEESQSQSISN